MAFRAYDRASTRVWDDSGALKAGPSVLTRAMVSRYYGHEMGSPAFLKNKGLDPARQYRVLRPREELIKALPRFQGLKLMNGHQDAKSDTYSPSGVVGAVTGPAVLDDDDAVRAPVVIWPGRAVQSVQDGSQDEFSVGYDFDIDPTPGIYKGQPYDLRMTNLRPDHVAVVPKGRVNEEPGPKARVEDAQQGTQGDDSVNIGEAMGVFSAMCPDTPADVVRVALYDAVARLNRKEAADGPTAATVQDTAHVEDGADDFTAETRKKLPPEAFGLPEKHAYPVWGPDGKPSPRHAAAAKAYATQELKKGHLTETEKHQIDAAADKVLAGAHANDATQKDDMSKSEPMAHTCAKAMLKAGKKVEEVTRHIKGMCPELTEEKAAAIVEEENKKISGKPEGHADDAKSEVWAKVKEAAKEMAEEGDSHENIVKELCDIGVSKEDAEKAAKEALAAKAKGGHANDAGEGEKKPGSEDGRLTAFRKELESEGRSPKHADELEKRVRTIAAGAGDVSQKAIDVHKAAHVVGQDPHEAAQAVAAFCKHFKTAEKPRAEDAGEHEPKARAKARELLEKGDKVEAVRQAIRKMCPELDEAKAEAIVKEEDKKVSEGKARVEDAVRDGVKREVDKIKKAQKAREDVFARTGKRPDENDDDDASAVYGRALDSMGFPPEGILPDVRQKVFHTACERLANPQAGRANDSSPASAEAAEADALLASLAP